MRQHFREPRNCLSPPTPTSLILLRSSSCGQMPVGSAEHCWNKKERMGCDIQWLMLVDRLMPLAKYVPTELEVAALVSL